MSQSSATQYSVNNPFLARLVDNRRLSRHGSQRDTRHLVVDISGSGLTYTCGDSLGVYALHRDHDVEAILNRLRVTGEEIVSIPRGRSEIPFREALRMDLYFLAGPTTKLLQALHEHASGPERDRLARMLEPAHAESTASFLQERHFVDVLDAFPGVTLPIPAFISACRKLTPRLYSIASSPLVWPQHPNLTVAVIRHILFGTERVGVASTFCADRVAMLQQVLPVFVSHSHFRLPEDPAAPIIMIGPGTGVAPFRGFLQHREALGASGRNWLFFGDQRAHCDFLYQDDFERWVRTGLLTRLDLAWSRDQDHKVYVQHRMLERAPELWRWIADGAVVYVCGDKSRMAADVDAALHQIVATQGGLSAPAAADYLKSMKRDRRYLRDVY